MVKKQRCGKCSKRIKSVLPIKCRCDKYYCHSHKTPYDHECSYDWVNNNKKIIEKENKEIRHDKVVRF